MQYAWRCFYCMWPQPLAAISTSISTKIILTELHEGWRCRWSQPSTRAGKQNIGEKVKQATRIRGLHHHYITFMELATCWPVPVSRIQKSLQGSNMIPSARWGVVMGRGGFWGWQVGRPPQAPLLRRPRASGLWVCQAIFSGKLEMLIHAPFKILLQGQIP